MRQVVPNIYMLEGLRVSNVYLIHSGAEFMLIDAGLASDTKQVVTQLRDAGFPLERLKCIILTHTHGDHTGGVSRIVAMSGAQVIAHKDEVPYIEKTQSLPASSFIQRLMNWMSDQLVFRQRGLRVDLAVDDGEGLGDAGGLTVIHTPGHTPGSLSVYHNKLGIVFCGDALFNAHPITRKPGLQLPLSIVSTDFPQAFESAVKLSRLQVKVLCCGHGEPITDDVNGKMRELLAL